MISVLSGGEKIEARIGHGRGDLDDFRLDHVFGYERILRQPGLTWPVTGIEAWDPEDPALILELRLSLLPKIWWSGISSSSIKTQTSESRQPNMERSLMLALPIIIFTSSTINTLEWM